MLRSSARPTVPGLRRITLASHDNSSSRRESDTLSPLLAVSGVGHLDRTGGIESEGQEANDMIEYYI